MNAYHQYLMLLSDCIYDSYIVLDELITKTLKDDLYLKAYMSLDDNVDAYVKHNTLPPLRKTNSSHNEPFQFEEC